jgi:hypothetical protein
MKGWLSARGLWPARESGREILLASRPGFRHVMRFP